MATYATYRHVELYRVGYGKKRVLKPPGGGSSISFGGEEPHPNKTTSPTAPHDNKSNGTPASTPSGGDISVKASPEPPKPASAPAATQQKQRVPPGGFSTALW